MKKRARVKCPECKEFLILCYSEESEKFMAYCHRHGQKVWTKKKFDNMKAKVV